MAVDWGEVRWSSLNVQIFKLCATANGGRYVGLKNLGDTDVKNS